MQGMQDTTKTEASRPPKEAKDGIMSLFAFLTRNAQAGVVVDHRRVLEQPELSC